jgi:hypothetical protein
MEKLEQRGELVDLADNDSGYRSCQLLEDAARR